MLTIFVSPYYHEGSEQKRGNTDTARLERVDPVTPSRTDSEQSEEPRHTPDTEKSPPDGQDS